MSTMNETGVVVESSAAGSVSWLVNVAFSHLLLRDPTADERAHWTARINGGLHERAFLAILIDSSEYMAKHRVVPGHPPGHFYSPVVDPADVTEYWKKSASSKMSDLSGVVFDVEAMGRFWRENVDFMHSMNFAATAGGATRYYLSDRRYPDGDALVLAGMINHHRPKRIVEIGSGFSSAAMLDAVDRLDLDPFHLTCIDPSASRLRSLLRADDFRRVTILEQKVQEVELNVFAELEAGDILFIDSSHVMKTGSDLHYELFSIIPSLRPGVLIHFHDIYFPFEYPEAWVFRLRWSWNEIYVIRAFLMYNSEFRVIFFTDMFLRSGAGGPNPIADSSTHGGVPLVGGSLWLARRVAVS